MPPTGGSSPVGTPAVPPPGNTVSASGISALGLVPIAANAMKVDEGQRVVTTGRSRRILKIATDTNMYICHLVPNGTADDCWAASIKHRGLPSPEQPLSIYNWTAPRLLCVTAPPLRRNSRGHTFHNSRFASAADIFQQKCARGSARNAANCAVLLPQ